MSNDSSGLPAAVATLPVISFREGDPKRRNHQNALESDELGVKNPVSKNERAALVRLRSWADRVVKLPGE